jgi:hypothetical protein
MERPARIALVFDHRDAGLIVQMHFSKPSATETESGSL